MKMRHFGRRRDEQEQVHIPGEGEVTRLGDACWIEGVDPKAPGERFPHGVAGMPRFVRGGRGLPPRAVSGTDLTPAVGDQCGLTCRYLFATSADRRECRETVEVANDVLSEATGRIRKQLKDLSRLRSLGKVRDLAFVPDAAGRDFTYVDFADVAGRGRLMRLTFVSLDDDGARGSFTGSIGFDEGGYVESVDVTSKTVGGDYRVIATRLPEDGLAVRQVVRVSGAGFRGIMYAQGTDAAGAGGNASGRASGGGDSGDGASGADVTGAGRR
ncbi:MAG: hypothetical protein SOI26_03220 [Coriobacteriales bacterium]